MLEELGTHAATAYEALRAEGCDPHEAERRIGDLIAVWVGEAADVHRVPKRSPAIPPATADGAVLAGLMQDVRYGVRLLRRQPGSAAIAVLTMALGIGATTMLFSVAYGVLLTPLPWSDPHELVRVTETRNGRSGRVLGTVSNGTFLAWRDQHSTIEDLGGWLTSTVTLTGAGDPVRAAIIPTTPSLFRMLRARPLIGRLFNEDDGAADQSGAVILSHGLWRERFGGRSDVVGQAIRSTTGPTRSPASCHRTSRFPISRPARGRPGGYHRWQGATAHRPEMFVSLKQIASSSIRAIDPVLVVRTAADPAAHVSTLRDLVHDEAPTLALDSVMTMEDRVMTSLATPRLYAVVLAWFGTFALLVAAVGLFGVLSFSVAQRTREIGVRSALGAQTHTIVALVLHQVLWIVGIGVLVGLGAAVAAVRLLSSFLYGISPHDALTFVGVPIVIVAIAAVSCLVPARRAATVDPLTALRAG